MSDLLLYLIKSNVALALFYLGYYLLLRKLTFYGINRYYLLFALAFSALYPSISIDHWFAANQDAPPQLLLTLSDWQQLQLPEETNILSSVFSSAYWISVSLFGLLFLIKLMGIGRIHFRSIPTQWQRFDYRKSNEDISPFSFWTNIYFNPRLYTEDEYEKIFSHEQVHVRQLHSLDILVAEIALIFFWYNPFCWMIRKAIQDNIEFITDQRVLCSGIDKKSYQYSLVQISTLSHPSYLGNHFNFKNLKKRIVMMNKKQSSKMQLGKYVFIIPAIVLGSLVFGVSKAYEQEDIQGKFKDNVKINFNISESATLIEELQDTTKTDDPLYIINGVKQTPEKKRNYNPQEIESVNVLKDKAAITVYGEEGKNGVVEITTKNKSGISPTSPEFANVIFILDGKKISHDEFQYVNPEDIHHMEILKGESAIALYGEEGKEGAIQIVTKKGRKDPMVEEVSRPDNKMSVNISTDSLQLTGNLENYQKDKEPVVMQIQSDKVTSLEGAHENVLLFVDGKRIARSSLDQIDPTDIQSLTVLKGKNATDRYGEEGKDGVIEIITKSKN